MLEQGELITLSNNVEYAVVSTVIYQGANYVYILDTENFKDFKICKYEDEELTVVKNEELLKVLIVKFNKDLKENLATVIEKYD